MLFLFLFLLLIVSLSTDHPSFIATKVAALTMQNENFRLELPDVLGEKVTSQVSPPQKPNPNIVGGFPETASKMLASKPFSFTLSALLVDFGIVSPTDPVTRTINLIIEKQAVNGYTVVAFQNHPLRAAPFEGGAQEIQDTTCDLGNCNEKTASLWSNPLVFGSGFRVDNVQGNASFGSFTKEQNYFMQFADLEASEVAFSIMLGQETSKTNQRNDEVRITHKVNVPASQKEGVYQNIIYYVAVPNF